jgi:hypothetical protein
MRSGHRSSWIGPQAGSDRGVHVRNFRALLGEPSCILWLVVVGIVVGSHGWNPGRSRRSDEPLRGLGAFRDGRVGADFRYVAFQSREDHPSVGDTNRRLDVYVKDHRTGTLTLASTDSAGNPGDGDSSEPSIGGDGRHVAFRSSASNLVARDTNGVADIFVKDLATGATTRVSTNEDGEQGDAPSSRPEISADGRYVIFLSSARNLVAEDTGGRHSRFRKDLATGRITRIDVMERVQSPPATTDRARFCWIGRLEAHPVSCDRASVPPATEILWEAEAAPGSRWCPSEFVAAKRNGDGVDREGNRGRSLP